MSENKKKFSIESVLMTTIILFVICTVVAAALAGTNYLTEDRISALNERNEKSSLAVVIPNAQYSKQTVQLDGQSKDYYTAQKDGEIIGYIATTSAKGYGGDISVMVGILTDGTISKIKVLTADDETPGLGLKVQTAAFSDQFAGLTQNALDSGITNITSATYSSEGVKNAVKEAYSIYEAVKQDKEENKNEAE